MDTIIINGNILTMEDAQPQAEAVAVQSGKIYKVGKTDEIEKLSHEGTTILDLKGQTMLPGFIDAHNHFCLYALLTDQVDCRPVSGCIRGEDIVAGIRAKAEKTPPGEWTMGWGFAPYLLDDKKIIKKEDLDRASGEHPICLVHVSVHEAVFNSLALKEMGITKETPDPPGGKIHRDSNGNPNGILSESAFMNPLFFDAQSIYSKIMNTYDRDARHEMMIRCAETHLSHGVVGAHDPFVDAPTLRTYQEVTDSGRFPFRIYAYILNSWADPLIESGIGRGLGSEWFKIGAIKIFLDGGMSCRTAAVYEPYAGGGGGTGILNYDQDGINREIEKFDGAGYQISVHAQGDRGLDMLLEAFGRTMERGNPLRHHIVHAGNLTSAQIEKVKELGLNIVSQANFFSLLGDGFIEAFGPERSQKLYRFGTLLKKNIKLAFSSDCPVADFNPLIGLRDAISRKTGSGESIGSSEAITVEQALSLYTKEAAYISFEESERGTIKEGKVADFVVLDKDPLKIPPEDIPDCKVKMTMVGGEIVYNQE